MSRIRDRSGRRGVAALEFALVLPVATLLLLGGTDLVFYLTDWFRLERTASETADIVSRADTLSAASFTTPGGYFAIADQIAAPLSVSGPNGATIVSAIVNNGTKTTIAWQQSNTANAAYVSKIGRPGGAPVLPQGYSVPSGQSVIAVEIYSGINPWVLSLAMMGSAGPPSVYVYSFYRPRAGDLSQLQ
jgi:Flp pilus assembly protein TadG